MQQTKLFSQHYGGLDGGGLWVKGGSMPRNAGGRKESSRSCCPESGCWIELHECWSRGVPARGRGCLPKMRVFSCPPPCCLASSGVGPGHVTARCVPSDVLVLTWSQGVAGCCTRAVHLPWPPAGNDTTRSHHSLTAWVVGKVGGDAAAETPRRPVQQDCTDAAMARLAS
jgi:hypothetical protein